MPAISFTPKEIHIIVQMLVFLMEQELAFDYASKQQLEVIRTKLQNVKDG
jgi:hypothetical protein